MKHVYVSNRASGFTTTVVYKDSSDKEVRHRIRFENGQFKTDDDTVAEQLDNLIATRSQVRRNIRKTDRAAAEKLAREHAERTKWQGAMKGGVTAEAAKRAMDTTLAQRDAELRSHHVDPADLADENLQITEAAPAAPAPAEVEAQAEAKPKVPFKLGGEK